jgi:hypothetical protein
MMPSLKGSPYLKLARVVVTAVHKGQVNLAAIGRTKYYVGDDGVADSDGDDAPSKRLRSYSHRSILVLADLHISRHILMFLFTCFCDN